MPERSETKYTELYSAKFPLVLESGETLAPVTVAYETYGALNADGTNAILICHALTANAHAASADESDASGWWDGLIGEGKAFDTAKYFIVSSNILGSCYGTSGPTSIDPKTGGLYRMSFPQITIRDMVTVQKRLLDTLGVKKLLTVSGGSLGGMQVLEWGVMFPEFCKSIIPISTAAKQSAWCIALNTVARAAMTDDPDWHQGFYIRQPKKGLSLARMIGMISYRSPEEFEDRFGRQREQPENDRLDFENRFEVEKYLQHQGQKLVDCFDANTYICISRAMDLHDVGHARGGVESALSRISAKVLCIGFDSDLRYPVSDQKEIVKHVPDGQYVELTSLHGHDAFLIEYEKQNVVIKDFLKGL
jgi:homoserine O-acetyltransferase